MSRAERRTRTQRRGGKRFEMRSFVSLLFGALEALRFSLHADVNMNNFGKFSSSTRCFGIQGPRCFTNQSEGGGETAGRHPLQTPAPARVVQSLFTEPFWFF